MDPKLLWAIGSATGVWLVAVSVWAGKLHSDVTQLKKAQLDDSEMAKHLAKELKSELYREGRSVFMPRSGCAEKSRQCVESMKNLHDQQIGEVHRDIKRLCMKFDEWQGTSGKLMAKFVQDNLDSKLDYELFAKMIAKEMNK